jgi:hypothetical protein
MFALPSFMLIPTPFVPCELNEVMLWFIVEEFDCDITDPCQRAAGKVPPFPSV